MPCQFISSCFYLENPWGKSDTAAGKFSAKAAQAQPVINQEPQPAAAGVDPAGVIAAPIAAVPGAANIGPDYIAAEIAAAANVEQQPKTAGGEVSTSPNGTPDKASNKARTAKTFRAYLPSQCHRTYSCVHCR